MGYRIDANQNIWRVVFSRTLTNSDLLEIVQKIKTIDTNNPVAPDGIVDMRDLDNIDLGFSDVNSFDESVRGHSLPNNVKVALLADRPIQYGFARMFQTLFNHPQVELEVIEDEKDALEWLSK